MTSFVLCVGCGTPLYGFSPCQWCTCEHCGVDLRDGFCPLCNSSNSCVHDPDPNSFDYRPDSYNPPHPTYETYSGDSYGKNSQLGYDCQTQFPLNYEPKPSYIQDYNSYPHDSSSSSQQYLCCDNCGGLHEAFQYQPTNQNFYNSNSFGSDQSQTPQFLVIHPPPQETSIKILHDHENVINSVQTFLRKFNRYSFFETPKFLSLAWDRVFEIKDALGTTKNKLEDLQELFRELSNDVQNIHEELVEYINTPVGIVLPFTTMTMMMTWTTPLQSHLMKPVGNLVPNPSESECENSCDMLACFKTFSNILFDAEYKFDSVDDQSLHNEDFPGEIFSNPLFEEEINSMRIGQHHFNVESDLIGSLLNHDSSIIPSSSKIDSLLDEFAGELPLLKSIPLGIDEIDYHPENEIRLAQRLLYDNSSPCPSEEFISKNSNADAESFSPFPILEEIDLTFTPDDDDDSRDILIRKELLDNYSLPLPENESFHFDIPSSSRPPAKPPD
nr:pre-mRNA splicing Prp18-interacting factor [Tanacetum cinerariifolium]